MQEAETAAVPPIPQWGSVTVDCLDPESLAIFWAALLGTSVRGRWQQYVHLHPQRSGGPVLAFQRVDAPAGGKNSLHLDLHVADKREVHLVVQRATELGARVVDEVHQDDTRWVVLQDPEGNLFCVVPVVPPDEA